MYEVWGGGVGDHTIGGGGGWDPGSGLIYPFKLKPPFFVGIISICKVISKGLTSPSNKTIFSVRRDFCWEHFFEVTQIQGSHES